MTQHSMRLRPPIPARAQEPDDESFLFKLVVWFANSAMVMLAGLYLGASRAGAWQTWWLILTIGLVVCAVVITWLMVGAAARRVGRAEGERDGIEIARAARDLQDRINQARPINPH